MLLTILQKLLLLKFLKKKHPKGFKDNAKATIKGSSIAGNARKELETILGKSVIENKNNQTLLKGRKEKINE